MHVSATELNQKPGALIDKALQEPVIIEKNGRPTVAMISYQHYLELEDAFWGAAAKVRAQNAEWASAEESEEFLKSS